MTYDPVGNMSSLTNFNGEVINYEYDKLNRLSKKILPDETFTMTYTAIGKMASVTDSRGTTTYSYDVRQRLTEQKEPDGKFLRYGYDGVGNRTILTTPSGTTTFTYDKYNQLATVNDGMDNLTTYTYDKAGNLTQAIMPNAVLEIRSYDTLNRLTKIESKKDGTVLFSAAYTLDNAGMRTKVVETGRTVNYSYDRDYRLLSENDGSSTTSYTYDANGNKKTETKAGVTTTYTWDAESRLKGSQCGSTNTVYDYDYSGIRVSQVVNGSETKYLVDKNRNYAQVLEEYDGSGVQASYVYGNDLISQSRNGLDSFYGYDGLGSTRVLTDEFGVVTDSYTYDAYGTVTASTGATQNNYLYTGEQFDKGLNQYYLRDRYYGTDIGRFTQRDRFEGDMMNPLSLNRYGYTHGNPVNATDPSGMFSLGEVAAAQSIMNSLANLQISSYGYLLSASFKGSSYTVGDFGIDFATNAFFVLAPMFAPFVVKGASNVLRSLRGAGGSGLPERFKFMAIGEIADSTVIAQERQLSCGPACGSMLLKDLNVTASQKTIIEAAGNDFLNKDELVQALTQVDPSATRSWYAQAFTTKQLTKKNMELLSNNGSFTAQISDGWHKHWIVVDSYDSAKNLLKVRDPAGSGTSYSLTLEDFQTLSSGAVVYPQ